MSTLKILQKSVVVILVTVVSLLFVLMTYNVIYNL